MQQLVDFELLPLYPWPEEPGPCLIMIGAELYELLATATAVGIVVVVVAATATAAAAVASTRRIINIMIMPPKLSDCPSGALPSPSAFYLYLKLSVFLPLSM